MYLKGSDVMSITSSRNTISFGTIYSQNIVSFGNYCYDSGERYMEIVKFKCNKELLLTFILETYGYPINLRDIQLLTWKVKI